MVRRSPDGGWGRDAANCPQRGWPRDKIGKCGLIGHFRGAVGLLSQSPTAETCRSLPPQSNSPRDWFVAQCGLVCGAFDSLPPGPGLADAAPGPGAGSVWAGKNGARLVPVYMHWEFHLKTGLLAALGRADWVPGLAYTARLVGDRRLAAVATFVGFHLLIAISVAMIDGGPSRLLRSYEQLSADDYSAPCRGGKCPNFGRLSTAHAGLPFIARRIRPAAWCFCGWWPRGLALVLARRCGHDRRQLLPCRRCIFGARNAGRTPARLATALFMLAPSIVLFSAACLDAVFMVPIVWAMFFLERWAQPAPIAWGILLAWRPSCLAVDVFGVVPGRLELMVLDLPAPGPSSAENSLARYGAAAATAGVLYLGLWFVAGYDPWGYVHHGPARAQPHHGRRKPCHGLPAFHLAIANLAALVFCAGIPLAVLWARRLSTVARKETMHDRGWIFDLSFVAALAIIDLAPLYTLEVEHIWLFMVPAVAICAARGLETADGTLSQSALPRGAVAASRTDAGDGNLPNTVW